MAWAYAADLLRAKIASVCPIDGVAIGDYNDAKTWRIDFAVTATPAQIAAAQQSLAAITSASLVAADAIVQAAVVVAPDPLAAAKAAAVASLPNASTPVVG